MSQAYGHSYPKVTAKDRGEWRRWLEQCDDDTSQCWLYFEKKSSSRASVTYGEALEEALCFGWIDARKQTVSETQYRQVFVRRSAKSPWSHVNRAHVDRLEEEGKMHERGRRAIAEAKASGSWYVEDAVTMENAPELQALLDSDEALRGTFEKQSASRQKTYVGMLVHAKRPETKEKRLAAVEKELRARQAKLSGGKRKRRARA